MTGGLSNLILTSKQTNKLSRFQTQLLRPAFIAQTNHVHSTAGTHPEGLLLIVKCGMEEEPFRSFPSVA